MATKSVIFIAAILVATLCLSAFQEAEADVLVGSCIKGGKNYRSNCSGYCKSKGYKNGHCGSFLNVNCWCEPKK